MAKPPALTPRELRIVQMRAGGLCFKEIALELGITLNTVQWWYWRNIKTKLGLQDQVAICRVWWEYERGQQPT